MARYPELGRRRLNRVVLARRPLLRRIEGDGRPRDVVITVSGAF